nr:probable E3 ubiquitin-protein ligase HERC3 isoform X2 [Misgurnus anguillicaudatus]
MLYSWGTADEEGFDVATTENTIQDRSTIKTLCSNPTIQDEPTGKYLGFIGDDDVSVLKMCRNGEIKAKMENFNLKKDKIKLMRSGQARALLLNSEGEILFMEISCSRIFKNLCDRQVTQVACGNQHSIAIISDGQLLVWGVNSHGQLGLGKGENLIRSPQPLRSLCGIPVTQISAGGDHSFALSLSGAVFGWGKNNSGQLGLGDTKERDTPTCVKSLNLKKTIFISCGEEHSAILTKGGFVFTFGSGKYGQLGHTSLRDEYHPRLVAELMGSKVSQIACGGHHTLAMSDSLNVIYSFGCGEQGQLGNQTTVNQSVPLPVRLPSGQSHALKVKKVLAGGNISFAQICHEENHVTDVITHSVCPTLDDQMIDRWMKECDTDAWREIAREIKKVFSSPSCVNGSFIDKSHDKHFQTSMEYSGLDLSLARLAFENIAKKTKVLLEVQHTVVRKLLPSLSVCPAGVEALRVYLILPELLRVLQQQKQQKQLAADLAYAILKLDPCDALESTKLITQMTTQQCDHWESLIIILSLLKRLFSVNRQRKCALMESQFCITEVADLISNAYEGKILPRNIEMLIPFSFLADTATKQRIFIYLQAKLIQEDAGSARRPVVPPNMCINRQSVLKDTLKSLKQGIYKFSQPLKVQFMGERGVDFSGLSAEFFSLLATAFVTWEKKLLKVYEDSQLVWFNPDICDVTDFYYLGIICGMALYNHHFININFPLALFKKLLRTSPTLNDFEELTPIETRSLKDLLMEDEEEVVDGLDLVFMEKKEELIPNGARTLVTKTNRQKYVDLYVDFIFNKSVRNQFEKFAEGFYEGCPISAWKMFHPEELRELVHGSPAYEWENLHKCATYEGCSSSDELIKNFWTVFFEFSEEQKKKFLFFMYGTDRVPAGGLSKRTLKIVQLNFPDSDDRFPEAQTCVGKLLLPKYSDIDTLRNKLQHAIKYCEVFGRE